MPESKKPVSVKAVKMDQDDPFTGFYQRFYIPKNTIYLDGNSLGLMSVDAEAWFEKVMRQWRELGIRGWLEADPPWFYLAEKLGAEVSDLVGAKPEEVVCTGATTVNIHSLVSTFFRPAGKRKKILADELNFPSDIYALKGQLAIRGQDPDQDLVLVPSADGLSLKESDIINHMDKDIALILLSSVLYRSGQLLDMKLLTLEANKRDILIGFDCSHSVGALPHSLSDWGVDFAVWCSYKYLNGGPGSPAFLYINKKHFSSKPAMAGWFGSHKDKQFDMDLEFFPANSAAGWQISTPSVLNAAPLTGSLAIIKEAGIARIRKRSLELTAYLIDLIDNQLQGLDPAAEIVTPRKARQRGGHVAIRFASHGYQIYLALKSRGIMPDFRPPGIIRFAPVALYNNFLDLETTVHVLKTILETGEYFDFPSNRGQVT